MTTSRFPSPLGDDALAQTWESAWSAVAGPAPTGLREQIERAWSGPRRHYHDRRHLGECLAFWLRWREHCERPGEVAIALWFHDAVYDPSAGDNELNSAAWAVRSLGGADVGVSRRVHDLIMATRHGAEGADHAHHAACGGADRALLLDIDLAILGSPPQRFGAYETDVRAEYASVPEPLYRSRRAALLAQFLDRPRLYRTAPAFQLLESQARVNLRESLHRLGQ